MSGDARVPALMRKAVYPGTFDPVTRGHLDVIERGCRVFDELVIAVAAGYHKTVLFPLEERVEMIRELVNDRDGVRVVGFTGMGIRFAREIGASVILRGIRTVSDFEHEFQMALTNRSLAEEVETVFVMPSVEWSYVSSSLIREVVASGGDVSKYVPPSVAAALRSK